MSTNTPSIRIGRWYLRWDKGEIFQVTGRDALAGDVYIRTFDGGSDVIPLEQWEHLPLGVADPPEDWAGPLETVDEIDMDCAQPPNS
jgi:hypothetical protein